MALEKFGLKNLAAVHWNLPDTALVEHAIANREGYLVQGGAFCAETGAHTGRSPKDKFVVVNGQTEKTVWWERNGRLAPEKFQLLFDDFIAHAKGKTLYAQDLYGGADPRYRIRTRVYNEIAWHSMFIRALLIRPARAELSHYVPDFTILSLPSFKADPKRHGVRSETVIALDFTRRIILIGGTSYAGEMKKAVFTTLNYYLPAESVMPMHCSANVGPCGRRGAVLRPLRHRQDDAVGRSQAHADRRRRARLGPAGRVQFRGRLLRQVHQALAPRPSRKSTPRRGRFGTVLENVVFDPETRICDFDDDSKTENTRAAYPLDFIPNASRTGRAGQPRNVVFLTADAFGVMPPIAKLTPAQAMYHFLSGYTAKVAGTEKGLVGVQPEFSTCFGAPFLPRHPSVYGNLLRELISAHDVDCWLVNTGWTGGIYGVGRRMPIKVTRTLLGAALDGSLKNVKFRTDPYFGFAVPTQLSGVEPHLLYPQKTWQNKAEFDQTARKLVDMFQKNFVQFEDHVDAEVRAAAPEVRLAAE